MHKHIQKLSIWAIVAALVASYPTYSALQSAGIIPTLVTMADLAPIYVGIDTIRAGQIRTELRYLRLQRAEAILREDAGKAEEYQLEINLLTEELLRMKARASIR